MASSSLLLGGKGRNAISVVGNDIAWARRGGRPLREYLILWMDSLLQGSRRRCVPGTKVTFVDGTRAPEDLKVAPHSKNLVTP